MDGISYRRAMLPDLKQMAGLIHALFSIERDFHPDVMKQRQGLALLLDRSSANCIVACRREHIVGMVTGQLVVSTAEGGFSLLVEDLIVRDDCRKLGIGSKLLEQIGDWGVSHGASRMQLLADRDNISGIDFYRKTGWQMTNLVGLRKYTP